MGSLGQGAGSGTEARPSLTSKLRDALGQALRSKQQSQRKNAQGPPGGTTSTSAQGQGLGTVQGKGLETYVVQLRDLAAAGGVPPDAAAAAVEGVTLSASTLQEVLHDLWGKASDTASAPTANHQAPGRASVQETGPEAELRGTSVNNGPQREAMAQEDGEGGAQPGSEGAPWTHVEGRDVGLESGVAAGFAPSALQTECLESVWYPIFGQCPSPNSVPLEVQQGALLPQHHPQNPPALPLHQQPPSFLSAGRAVTEIWEGPGRESDQGGGGESGGEGALDFEVGLEQLDAAFGELQDLLDSLQEEGNHPSQPPNVGPPEPQAQGHPGETQWEVNGSNGNTQGTPGISEGQDGDRSQATYPATSPATSVGVEQALQDMRVGEGETEQQGSTPVAPLTKFGAGTNSATSGGVLLEGERSNGSSQSGGAASTVGVPQAKAISQSHAAGAGAGGQRRRQREEEDEGDTIWPPEDPSAGRSTALRTGAAQAGAEAAAYRGAAAAARARLRLNELQAGVPEAGGGLSGRDRGPVALLEAVATAIAKGQEEEAQRLLEVLHEVSSQYGDAAQRVAAYCLQGFQAALPPLSPASAAPVAASIGPGTAPPSSPSSSSATSSSSGAAGSHSSSGKNRSPLLSLGWVDRALRRGGYTPKGAAQALGGGGSRVKEGEAMARAEVDCQPEVMKSFQVLMSATPLVTFGHVTANCALLEATAGAPRVHLVDIGTGHGLHLVPLIRAWAARPSGAPTVHLTLVDVASTELHRAYCVIETSLRLKHAAEQFGLQGAGLTMDVVYVKLEELEPQHVAPRPGHTCVVNCTLRLSQHLEGALSAPAPAPPTSQGLLNGTPTEGGAVGADRGSDAERDAVHLLPKSEGQVPGASWNGIAREEQACRAVVRVIKALRPAVCTCVEYRVEASTSSIASTSGQPPLSSSARPPLSSPHMLSRFLETIHHYVGIFESLDATVGRQLSHEQRVLEKDILGRTIAASVACHGHWHRSRLHTLSQQQQQPLQGHPGAVGEAPHAQGISQGSSQDMRGGQGLGVAGQRLTLGGPASEVCHSMLLSERLRRGGLLRRAVSPAEFTTAQQLLSLYRDGFGLRLDEPNCLTLTWKGRALLSSSAWML